LAYDYNIDATKITNNHKAKNQTSKKLKLS